MLKKCLVIMVGFLASCSWFGNSGAPLCPYVTIPRDTAYVTQKVNYEDEFQIELVGYEGYCSWENNVNRRYAMITPLFVVHRLRDSDETRVDFGFYTETVKGPPAFIGKKAYSESVMVGKDEKEKEFKGHAVKVRVPEGYEPFEILLGLDVSREEHLYNQRTFDVKYRYNVQKDPMYMEKTIVKTIEVPAPECGCRSCCQ